jgi:hypothetical protein
VSIQDVPIRPPRQWSPEWFQRWVYETLAPFLDAGGSSGGDVTDLINASLVSAIPEASLPNARTLIGQPGTLTTVDHGPGESVEIRIENGGVNLGQLAPIPGPSLLGNAFAGDLIAQAIPAGSDDTVARRAGGAVDFGQLTAGMFPALVVPDAALSANVALYDGDVAAFSSGAFVDARISESSVVQHEDALILDWSQLTGDQILVPTAPTAGRPTPAGVGAMIFDTTLGLPIWHDGTNWIDAAGNVV